LETARPVKPAATLTVRTGDLAGTTLRLVDEEQIIGRSTESTHILEHPQISRLHASITRQAGMFVLTDLGSAAGTKVDGEALDGPRVLHHGDVVEFGPVELVFEDPTEMASDEQDTMVMQIPDEVTTGPSLSPRQQEVLEGMAEGLTNSEIGERLGITERTVKAYAQELYTKLDVNNRAGAVAEAAKQGLLDL
jgi:DNA-binding CsgD family transcriptional regulator